MSTLTPETFRFLVDQIVTRRFFLTSEETLKSKLAFERYALSHGVHIKHYHADNGRFKDTLFTSNIEEKGFSFLISILARKSFCLKQPNIELRAK